MYKLERPNRNNIQNREYRNRLQQALVSMAFAIVAFIFSILNIISKNWTLCIVTLTFSFLSIITTIFSLLSNRLFKPSRYVFLAIIIVIFTYFLLLGGTQDGYSTYWVLLLPFCAMIVYGWKTGSIASGIMFIEIVAISIIYRVNPSILPFVHPMESFYIRFPFTYLAAFFLAFMFEFIKESAFKANESLVKRALDNANKDTLTGLKNRNWLSYYLREHKDGFNDSTGVMMIDVDNFKQANDIYGHFFGDKVLTEVSKVLLEVNCSHAVRWGGDEFILICEKCNYQRYKEIAENLREKAEQIRFENDPEFHLSLSIGVAVCGPNDNISLNELINTADKQASLAKSRGKNSVYSIFCGK